MRKLPSEISQRTAAVTIATAVGAERLAVALRGRDSVRLDANELIALDGALNVAPDPRDVRAPGVDFTLRLVDAETLASWNPPELADTLIPGQDQGTPLRFARPADSRGAIFTGDQAAHEPVGTIGYWMGVLKGLVMRGMHLREREGAQRRRPTPLDSRAILRIIVGLMKRCTPAEPSPSAETNVALLLWVHGHCDAVPRIEPPHAGAPGEQCIECGHKWIDHPTNGTCGGRTEHGSRCNCNAKSPELPDWMIDRLRSAFRQERRDDPYAIPVGQSRGTMRTLPAIDCPVPFVTTRQSVGRLTKAIRDFTRGRDGEYKVVRAKHPGRGAGP